MNKVKVIRLLHIGHNKYRKGFYKVRINKHVKIKVGPVYWKCLSWRTSEMRHIEYEYHI